MLLKTKQKTPKPNKTKKKSYQPEITTAQKLDWVLYDKPEEIISFQPGKKVSLICYG